MAASIRIIDSHAHVQFPAYDEDRDDVIARARAAGIGMVNVGTQYSTSADAIRLAELYPEGVWATAGFHPNHIDAAAHHDPQELKEHNTERFDYKKFLDLARRPQVVAVGECGLDYAHFARERSARLQNGASAEATGEGGLPQEGVWYRKKRQQEVFKTQIELALEVGKPLVIHCRDAFHDLIPILASYFSIHVSRPNGVVHFFSGSWEDARRLMDLGFSLGFGGVITFARDYDEVIRKAPLNRMVVETDAPYVAPVPHRGKRNEPAYVMEAAKKIAELRGIGFNEFADETTANAKRLFNIETAA